MRGLLLLTICAWGSGSLAAAGPGPATVQSSPATSGPAPAAPPVATDAPTAPARAVERRLFSDAAEASSFLWNDWNRFQENYHPNYIVDDDATTGWVAGAEGTWQGEWVRIAVTPLEQTSGVRLRIRNGYQESDALFKANARAKEIIVKLLPSGIEKKVVLASKQGWQDVTIEQPIAPGSAPTTDARVGLLHGVELKIVSAYEGSKFPYLVISDVQVFATSLARENPIAEKAKRDNLMKWRKERAAAAKQSAGARGADIPLFGAYRTDTNELGADAATVAGPEYQRNYDLQSILDVALAEPRFAAWRDEVKVAQELARTDFKAMKAVQVSPLDRRALPALSGLVAPDAEGECAMSGGDSGLHLPMLNYVSALTVEDLRVIEQKTGSTVRAKRADIADAKAPARVVALLVSSIHLGERLGRAEGGDERLPDGSHPRRSTEREQLLVFRSDGRLALVAFRCVTHNGPKMAYVDGYDWAPSGKLAGGRSVTFDNVIDVVNMNAEAK